MNHEEKLQRLLRLKRYEHPPADFPEEFLEKFQRRQRSELVRRSVLSLFRDRFEAWREGLRRPAVAWSAAGLYAALMLTLWLVPRSTPPSSITMVVGTVNAAAPQVDYQPANPAGTHSVSAPATNVPPGKRRTTTQDQNKEEIIGPEEKSDGDPQPPLRDL
jgi:hypothetical protein